MSETPQVTAQHDSDYDRASREEEQKQRNAVTVALAALAALVLLVLIASWRWTDPKDAAAVIGPVAAVVGTVVGGYLGHHAGSTGRSRDAVERRELTNQLLRASRGG
jgi:TRAP-type C4-dicarboxylate transport system permease large subunit